MAIKIISQFLLNQYSFYFFFFNNIPRNRMSYIYFIDKFMKNLIIYRKVVLYFYIGFFFESFVEYCTGSRSICKFSIPEM